MKLVQVIGCLIFAVVSTLNAQAADSVASVTCTKGSASYTVVVTSRLGPSSKLMTNVNVSQFSVNPDGTGRMISDEVETTMDRIFDTKDQALAFFDKHEVILRTPSGKTFILSLGVKGFMILDFDKMDTLTLRCTASAK